MDIDQFGSVGKKKNIWIPEVPGSSWSLPMFTLGQLPVEGDFALSSAIHRCVMGVWSGCPRSEEGSPEDG